MNPDLEPAVQFIMSIEPKTMREKVAKEQALEAVHAVSEANEELAEGEAAEGAYLQFRNMEEVKDAIDAGTLSAETALMLEKATKKRVTYIEYLEDRIRDEAEEGDD